MARIVATIDYEPFLEGDSYPSHIKTKADAMRFDLQDLREGVLSDLDLISFAESIEWEVVE